MSKKKYNLKNLKRIVNNRPIVFFALGPSVEIFERLSHRVKSEDICYGSLNECEYIEDRVLGKIDKKFSFISQCDAEIMSMPFFHRYYQEFIDRDDDNVFLTGNMDNPLIKEWIKVYKYKPYQVDHMLPREGELNERLEQPNSLALILADLIYNDITDMIFLFGMDGYYGEYGPGTKNPYYQKLRRYDTDENKILLGKTTREFNDRIELFNKELDFWKNRNCKVYNCNKKSLINGFPKISAVEFIELIKHHRPRRKNG